MRTVRIISIIVLSAMLATACAPAPAPTQVPTKAVAAPTQPPAPTSAPAATVPPAPTRLRLRPRPRQRPQPQQRPPLPQRLRRRLPPRRLRLPRCPPSCRPASPGSASASPLAALGRGKPARYPNDCHGRADRHDRPGLQPPGQPKMPTLIYNQNWRSAGNPMPQAPNGPSICAKGSSSMTAMS